MPSKAARHQSVGLMLPTHREVSLFGGRKAKAEDTEALAEVLREYTNSFFLTLIFLLEFITLSSRLICF